MAPACRALGWAGALVALCSWRAQPPVPEAALLLAEVSPAGSSE